MPTPLFNLDDMCLSA